MGGLRVVGVDPGTRRVGWAVLEGVPGEPPARLASGLWSLGPPPGSLAERLHALSEALAALLHEWRPGLVALESGFFGRNARSALRMGEARGVVLARAAAEGLPVLELPPALVKRRVAGSGQAGKEQLARMVALQLGLEAGAFAADDESDALAIALCALLQGFSPGAAPAPPGTAGLPPDLAARMREQ